MRIPHSAHTLIEQVRAEKKNAKAKPLGEPDGFGVVRTIAFDKATSKWLAPLLEGTDDRRIVSSEVNEDGVLEVSFSARTDADQRHSFFLNEASSAVGD